MKRYQISDPYEKNSFPIRWNELPDKVLQAKEQFYELFEFKPGSGMKNLSVLYFRSVRKFKEGTVEVEDLNNNVIYGLLK